MVVSPEPELPMPQENTSSKLEPAASSVKAADVRMDAIPSSASLVQQALGTCGQDNSRFLRAIRERLRR